MIDELSGWTNDIPPLVTPQRFGNLAFRTWGRRLEENSSRLISTLYDKHPDECTDITRQLEPYLLASFGSFGRMDYGTGHEVSFAMFLLCLSLLDFFSDSSNSGSSSSPLPATSLSLYALRHLVLTIFPAYLKLCYKLQDIYRLEPAGSHGVWGLDDSSFLPYLWGSGMLREETEYAPDVVLRKGLGTGNLYYVGVDRVRELKNGPFHEHSSQLHSIAVGVKTWKKVNEGMFKMYEAEVLSKRVVVQHLPLGGLIAWDPSSANASAIRSSVPSSTHMAPPSTSYPTPLPTSTSHSSAYHSGATGAPWASSTMATHGVPATGAPWASTARPAAMPPTAAPWASAPTYTSSPVAPLNGPGTSSTRHLDGPGMSSTQRSDGPGTHRLSGPGISPADADRSDVEKGEPGDGPTRAPWAR